jgi:hypothetical protein
VHDNAQLAVVGVGLGLMEVRYLRNGQQDEKDKAYNSNNRQKAAPAATVPAGIRLKSCQSIDLALPIVQSSASIWTLVGANWLRLLRVLSQPRRPWFV